VIGLSLLAHAALIAVLLQMPASKPPTAAGVAAMDISLIDGKARFALAAPMLKPHVQPAQKPSREPKARPLPPDLPDVAPQYVDFEPGVDEARLNRDPAQDPVALAVAENAASGRACQLGGWLQAALRADPTVQSALAAIPRADRSVANAIMLWNLRWVRQPPSALAGASVLRSALMVGVRAAPPECQTQLVRGPELLVMTDASGTTLIAIGSGEWRWADLLAQDPEEAQAASANF
jgi:hypothetical protein